MIRTVLNMELTQLNYFRVVARLEHITRAAEELHISQPSLSKTISRLEESAGVRFFDREGNKIRLNNFGRIFLQRVDKAFLEIEDGLSEISSLDDISHGQVTFSTSDSGFISGPLKSFMISSPNIRILQYVQSISQMRTSLEKGEIDFSISFFPLNSDSIEWTPVISDEIIVFVSSNHHLASKETISLAELENERFLFNSCSFSMRKEICESCRKSGFEPDVFYAGNENELVDILVERSLGVLFIPYMSFLFRSTEFPRPPERPNSLVKYLYISEPVGQRTMGISTLRGHYLSKASKKFCEYLIHYSEQVSNQSAV